MSPFMILLIAGFLVANICVAIREKNKGEHATSLFNAFVAGFLTCVLMAAFFPHI